MAGRRSSAHAEDANTSSNSIFRGFLSGDAFQTKKGRRGIKMDSMWMRFLMDSFDTDDLELAQIALGSVIAHLGYRVSGGEIGCSYNIGDYGFFTKEQFDKQAKLLSSTERDNITGDKFLSGPQWEEVDKKLAELAAYSSSRFESCSRDDTLLNLALRKCAFAVARYILEEGTKSGALDPLVTNELNQDCMDILSIGYQDLGKRLRILLSDVDKASQTVILSEEQIDLDNRIALCREQLASLASYNDALLQYLISRQVDIEADVRKKRFNELRAMHIEPHVIWNINKLDKCVKYQQDCEQLKGSIQESSNRLEECLRDHVSLADVVGRKHLAIEQSKLGSSKLAPAQDQIVSSAPTRQTRARKERKNQPRRRVQLAVKSNNPVDTAEASTTKANEATMATGDDVEVASNQPTAQILLANAATSGKDINSDDTRLALVYNTKTASQSRKDVYARAGLKMGTADDYSPILGTLYQTEYELVQYR